MSETSHDFDEQLIRDVDVARVYGVDRVTVWRWLKAGRIPKPAISRNDGRYTRWHKSAVMKAVSEIGKQEREEAAS